MTERDGRVYLDAGDEIEGDAVLLTVTGDVEGQPFDMRLGDGTELKCYEQGEEEDLWEVRHVTYDLDGDRDSNPMYGRLYFER